MTRLATKPIVHRSETGLIPCIDHPDEGYASFGNRDEEEDVVDNIEDIAAKWEV